MSIGMAGRIRVSNGWIWFISGNGFAEILGLRVIQVLALQGVEVRVLFWHHLFSNR